MEALSAYQPNLISIEIKGTYQKPTALEEYLEMIHKGNPIFVEADEDNVYSMAA